jgi:exonuclease III
MVAKRLDRFLLSEELIENLWSFNLRVEVGGISDHIPMLLEI